MNENNFLPIGTICKISKSDNLVMIAGYSLDGLYYGLKYPDGKYNNSSFISFAKDNINEVIFKGYENDDYKLFINNLVDKSSTDNDKNSNIFKDIEFDENGVVIFKTNDDYHLSDSSQNKNEDFGNFDVSNPFITDYSNITNKPKNNTDSNSWPIFSNIIFDENGVVVSSDVRYNIENE